MPCMARLALEDGSMCRLFGLELVPFFEVAGRFTRVNSNWDSKRSRTRYVTKGLVSACIGSISVYLLKSPAYVFSHNLRFFTP